MDERTFDYTPVKSLEFINLTFTITETGVSLQPPPPVQLEFPFAKEVTKEHEYC